MTSVARRHEDSGEYSDGSQDIEHNSAIDGGPAESDYDSQGSDSDHSERDPDSQETERRVDDDEDRSNPQYIPKRGTFYEHDDRTAASGEESSNTTSELSTEKKEGSESGAGVERGERRRPPRKSDVINKWSHDKYNENEQTPKSREELVAIYGYDIRNEDAPPHARRNRRYGRGPNKYTRTWEDEEAYRRQNAAAANTPQARKPPNPEDFPELDATRRQPKKNRTPVTYARPRSKSQPNSNESLENGTSLRRNASIKTTKKPAPLKSSVKNATVKTPAKITPRKDDRKMPAIENLTITASINNSEGPARRVSTPAAASVGQQRPVPTPLEHTRKVLNNQQPQPSNNSQSKPQQQQPSTQQKQQSQQQHSQQQQQQQQTGGEQRGGSKRYSSLRQRPLADNYTPQQQQQLSQQQQQPQQQQQQQPQPQPQQQQLQQPQQQQLRYHAATGNGGEFNSTHQGSPAHPQHQHIIHQQVVRTVPGPGAAPAPQPSQQHNTQAVRQQQMLLDQQQLVSHQHHSMHNIQQQHIGQLQPSQGYAPPAMMPAQYMQSGVGVGVSSGAVYGQTAMYAPAPTHTHAHAQYTHGQIYPHHNYVAAQATQAGGVTYFSCAEQETAPRAQRRPTAAIPILKPQPPDRPANSTERDNIDRIVENMFVRKPWPTQGAESREKSTSERSSQEPTKDSQPNSLTSSTISNDSKPSEKSEEDKNVQREEKKEVEEVPSSQTVPDSIQDA